MARSPQFDDFARTVDLLSTPLVVRVLYGLGDGYSPLESVPDGSDTSQIEEAVRRLADVGALRYGLDGLAPPYPEHAVLTQKGRRILDVLQTPSAQFADEA